MLTSPAIFSWEWAEDGKVLTFVSGASSSAVRIDTRRITGAVVIPFPGPVVPGNFPIGILPGLDRLFAVNRHLSESFLRVVVASGPSALSLSHLNIPRDSPATQIFLSELAERLGPRWLGAREVANYQTVLGVSFPLWFSALMVLALIGFGYFLLFAMAAFAAVLSGQWQEIPWIAWLALGGWCLLMAVVLRLSSGLKRRTVRASLRDQARGHGEP